MIKHEKPTIYDKLHETFGVEWDKGIIIAYYPNIYCKFELSEEKIAHEELHLERQKDMGVELWWNLYINNISFRLEEEILAIKAEMQKIREMNIDRNHRRFLFNNIYEDLSSSIYGKIITKTQAKQILG